MIEIEVIIGLIVVYTIGMLVYGYFLKRNRMKEKLGIYFDMTKEQRCRELERRIDEDGVGYITLEDI